MQIISCRRRRRRQNKRQEREIKGRRLERSSPDLLSRQSSLFCERRTRQTFSKYSLLLLLDWLFLFCTVVTVFYSSVILSCSSSQTPCCILIWSVSWVLLFDSKCHSFSPAGWSRLLALHESGDRETRRRCICGLRLPRKRP